MRAMRTFFDGSGQPVKLSGLLGKGGEGSVYSVAESADLAAKIYHHAPNSAMAAKLAAMVALKTPALLQMTAWPMETLHSKSSGSGSVVGLLMRKVVEYKHAHALYGPKSRRTEFANANWPFLIHAAANAARAFATVHDHGHVIGDVNHSNVMIGPLATVMMIDCDSFQILPAQGSPFLCQVGVSTYTPPELQGKALNTILRTANHDNFGLAVLIFHLLFMGRHPFAGQFLGQGDMPIEAAIQDYRFAFGGDSSQTLMQPPPNTLPLAGISTELGQFLERAFSSSGSNPGGRPAAREWAHSLNQLAKELKRCSANPAHDYLRSMTGCPWCDIERKTRVVLFNVHVLGTVASPSGFEITVVWERILSIGIVPPAPLPSPESFAGSLQPVRGARRKGGLRRIGNLIGLTLTLVPAGLLPFVAMSVAFTLWLTFGSVIVWLFIARKLSTSQEQAVWRQKVVDANLHLLPLERNWKQYASESAFVEMRNKLEDAKQEYDLLPAARQRLLQNLEADRERAQFEKHLESAFLQAATISGIGPGRKATLESFGIETAADISAAALDPVPGFGPALKSKLLAWRQAVGQSFVFDPTRGIDPGQVQALDVSIATRRKELEQVLLAGAGQLDGLKARILSARSELLPAFETHMRNRVQAELNLRAL